MWPLENVKPYELNPRLNDAAVDAVIVSIREFGWRQPIVVDADGVIIVGHTRWKAAKKMGLATVPVHVASDLPPEKVKAYRIADNQTADLSDWDMDKLPAELLALEGMDYDLSLLGFGDSLAEMMNGTVTDGLTDPDDVPAPPDEAVTKPDDLIVLGDHRLLCGDSSKPEDLDRLLAGGVIHLVNTDPPYNVKVEPRSNNAIAAEGVLPLVDQRPRSSIVLTISAVFIGWPASASTTTAASRPEIFERAGLPPVSASCEPGPTSAVCAGVSVGTLPPRSARASASYWARETIRFRLAGRGSLVLAVACFLLAFLLFFLFDIFVSFLGPVGTG
jgi:hypothetical protein